MQKDKSTAWVIVGGFFLSMLCVAGWVDVIEADLAVNTRNVELLPWVEADKIWQVGQQARVFDIESRKAFIVTRIGGNLHSDIEPLTWNDAKVMKEIYGGKWSWNRRAVVIQMKDQFMAASINGMPHGRDTVKGNGFEGMVYCHFLHSRGHASGVEDADHQGRVLQAANIGQLNKEELQQYAMNHAKPKP